MRTMRELLQLRILTAQSVVLVRELTCRSVFSVECYSSTQSVDLVREITYRTS